MGFAYRRGINRIFYQAENFEEGITVAGIMWSPELKKTTMDFIELEQGLYYTDFLFEIRGEHCGLFFEDGVKIKSLVFRVAIEEPVYGEIR